MKVHVLVGCVLCLISFVAESHAWVWPFGKSKDKPKVDGGWSHWGPWSSCLQEETPRPYRHRKRTCSDPAPKNGGSACKGVDKKTSDCKNCTRALGLENGKIKDGQISSPSFHNEFSALNARLNGDSSWCADIQDDDIYLEVDLLRLTTISAIATQGYYPDPQVMSLRRGRVSKYELMYSHDGLSWERYTGSTGSSELKGNGEKYGTVTNVLAPVINARFVRIYPLNFFSFMCMRVELYGCYITCGGRLTENPGSLDAKSSESEEKDCMWLVDLPNTRKIHFDFVNFDVPCINGEVIIREGSVPYEVAPVLGQYCGIDETPPAIVGSKGKLWVRFISNASDPHVGFYANYFPGCGGHLRTDEGMMESPNYPNNYFHNSKCIWTITVSKGKGIHLQFPHFDVDGDSDRHRCPTDHVSIWDGVNSGAPLIGRFCNSNRPPSLICSSNGTLKLKFRANDVIARTGFLAQFRAVKADTVCTMSSSLPTMTLTPSFTSLASLSAVTVPVTSTNLLVTKTTAYLTTLPAFAFSTIVPASSHQFNTTKLISAYMQSSYPGTLHTIPVVSSFGNVSRNSSHNENPDLLARKNDEEDDDDDLITIIIISAFGFVVLCLVVASILPCIKNHCEKKKKEKELNSCMRAEIAATHNLPRHGEFFPGNFQEPDESSVFLPVKPDSVSLSRSSTEELPPEYEAASAMYDADESSKKTSLEEDNVSVHSEINESVQLHGQEAEPEAKDEDMAEEGDFNISCQDLSASFALEMQAVMSRYNIGNADPGLELTMIDDQNASPLKNSAYSLQGSNSQHGSTASLQHQLQMETEGQNVPADAPISSMSTGDDHQGDCVIEENPQNQNEIPEHNVQYPEECDSGNHGTPSIEVPPPACHVQPDRNLGRTRGMKPKGKVSTGSFAESKDSGCASSLENFQDIETCV